jgi:hypothetical protein
LYAITDVLNSPSGSKIDAVMASTLRFIPSVKSVGCAWVRLLLTCSLLLVGFLSNPRVVNPSSLSSDNVDCVSYRSVGMVFRNAEWFDAHFLNVNPAV